MATGVVIKTGETVFEKWEMPDGRKMYVHAAGTCIGATCVIHNPSDHFMRDWTLHYRGDRNIFERLCPEHGVGHPDPDQRSYWDATGQGYMSVHGCCGCCVPPSSVVSSAQPKKSRKKGS